MANTGNPNEKDTEGGNKSNDWNRGDEEGNTGNASGDPGRTPGKAEGTRDAEEKGNE